MKCFLTIFLDLVLAGCSASAKYDIDVKCWKDEAFIGIISISEGDTEFIDCYEPEHFSIQCDKASVQKVTNETLCTTHDKKSVRIVEFAPTMTEVRSIYPNAKK